MKDALRVGVIGAGLQGQLHIKCYQSLPNVQVTAIADIDDTKLKRVGEQYGIKGLYTDFRHMLAQEKLDAVSVVTPDFLHREPALASIKAGKHPLIEKPLATTIEDAQAIVDAARKAKVKLMVNFSNRWMTYMAHTKKSIADGELGYPIYAYARLSNTLYVPTRMLGAWSSKTSLPFWLMSHLIDRVRWLFASEITQVYAVSHATVLRQMGIDSPDLFATLVKFANGAIGNFESCWILPESKPSVVDSKMELIFSEGNVSIDAQQTTIQKATAKGYSIPGTLQMDIFDQPQGFVTEALRHFVHSIIEDKQPWPSGEDGLAVTRVCVAIVESAQKGQPVEL